MSKIRVLVVDDSALVRQAVSAILNSDKDIEVVAVAQDPFVAREKVKELAPDVITLDVEMPRMDGLTFLEKLMVGRPTPVVMLSSLTEEGCATTMRALELGAVDFFSKPKLDLRNELEQQSKDLIYKVKVASRAKVKRREKSASPAKKLACSALIKTTDTIIAIGASTGGTEALRDFLSVLPSNTPPIIITQHMPPKFTTSFANRLNDQCQVSVKEAEQGDSVLPGHVLIAPGDYHMELVLSGARYSVKLQQEERVNRFRPSVDVMFRSVAKVAASNSVGMIFTGMGNDGAKGMKAMHQAGSYNFAQNEASCVVYGMPKMAVREGAVHEELHLDRMASRLLEYLEEKEQVGA